MHARTYFALRGPDVTPTEINRKMTSGAQNGTSSTVATKRRAKATRAGPGGGKGQLTSRDWQSGRPSQSKTRRRERPHRRENR
eukprot:10924992-Alexandrium_andersonii.AAC.1